MLCIFKTPLEPAKDIAGNVIMRPGPGGIPMPKVKAKLAAGDVQSGIQAAIGQCVHGPDIQFRKEGCKRLQLQSRQVLKRRADHSPVTGPDEVSARASAQSVYDALYVEETEVSVVGEAPEPTLNRIFVSPSLTKPDGSPVSLADFPDNWSFGNGVTVGVAVPLKGFPEPVILSWCLLEATAADQVIADTIRRENLRVVMET